MKKIIIYITLIVLIGLTIYSSFFGGGNLVNTSQYDKEVDSLTNLITEKNKSIDSLNNTIISKQLKINKYEGDLVDLKNKLNKEKEKHEKEINRINRINNRDIPGEFTNAFK